MITLSQTRDTMRLPLIVNDDERDILVQTDYDYPGVASSFGWSVQDVPRSTFDSERYALPLPCRHDGTDGTVDCTACGATAGDFIASAREWLDDHIGATADDPGYFSQD